MLLSLVIPVYNEQEVLPVLLSSLRFTLQQIDCDYEIVFVNDGSRDRTAEMLRELCAEDRRLKAISFSRNFGHQAAITAGLDVASGDAVVVMDADLQDPPDVLIEMVAQYRAGFEIVSAQRISRDTDSFVKRSTAAFFYWLMRRMVDERLTPEVGDFRLFSRAALTAVRAFREQHRFMRGLVAWLGLKEAIVRFERNPRAAGETKYPMRKMLKFAWTAISSFSALPLRLTLAAGGLLTTLGFAYAVYVLYAAIALHQTIRGWASMICLNIIFSGATLIALGLVGDYVSRIYEEVKGRPLYIVSDFLNLPLDQVQIHRAVIVGNALSRADRDRALRVAAR